MCYCSKNSNSNEGTKFILEGTCYLNDQPESGIEVEFGLAKSDQEKELTFDRSTKKTGSDGNYKFEKTIVRGLYQFRVRAKHPKDGSWSSYHQKAAIGTQTKNFYFSDVK